jgi:hypothetical protein
MKTMDELEEKHRCAAPPCLHGMGNDQEISPELWSLRC